MRPTNAILNSTGNKNLTENLSQQKQFCLLVRPGSMLVKYLQKKLAISFGLEISRESALNIDGKPRFPLFLLRISFRTFQVALTFDFSFSICFS